MSRFGFCKYRRTGFTLVELLVVIAIIGILSSVVLVSLNVAREKAYYARTQAEFRSMGQALELYYDDFGLYPDDAARNVPPGLEAYLANGNSLWPSAPWPDSVYDWDNWDNPDPGHTGEKIYQISVRFCPVGGPLSACRFPNEPWAAGFDIDSAVYYCISGSCRSHVSQPTSYPGYCVNC